ncbi:hypothetical protein I552_2099 [Mycobacterium xenopi 3993]|nr:hypothetical protein I552_2099 [Mycobacterium xenopi 3993]
MVDVVETSVDRCCSTRQIFRGFHESADLELVNARHNPPNLIDESLRRFVSAQVPTSSSGHRRGTVQLHCVLTRWSLRGVHRGEDRAPPGSIGWQLTARRLLTALHHPIERASEERGFT